MVSSPGYAGWFQWQHGETMETAKSVSSDARLEILRTFSERARRLGIRSIVMSELCSDLGVSKKTLYRYFSSKEEMVEAVMERWENRLKSPDDPIAHPPDGDPINALKAWIERWNSTDANYSDVFWHDLERDYPALYARYRQAILERSAEVRRLLSPMLRPGISDEFALQSYRALVDGAKDPAFADAVGMTRKQAMLTALDVLLHGILRPEIVRKMNETGATTVMQLPGTQ
jgi:AcrR family transcriptional regulator